MALTRPKVLRHLLVVGAVPLLLSTAAIGCGERGQETTEAVGPIGEGRTVDTSPFQMANPTTTSGATTVPGPGPTLYRPTTTDPSTGEAAVVGELPPSQGGPMPGQRRRTDGIRRPAPTSTTTTTAPPMPDPVIAGEFNLVDTASITSVCGMTSSVVSFFAAPDVSRSMTVAPLLLANMDRYVEVAPGDLVGDVVEIRRVVQLLVDLYAEGGGQLEYPPLATVVEQLRVAQPPYDRVAQSLIRARAVERLLCR